MHMSDAFNLQRFLDAQSPVFAEACAELRRGRKTSHWMWFIFPQIRGLGRSSTTEWFAIGSMAEASAYAAHPVLGVRLRECCRFLLALESNDAHAVFGFPDDRKLKSSMTLFARATPEEPLFRQVLDKFFGEEDVATMQRIF
jgi:uncharacterized protein (DUF1810 family)